MSTIGNFKREATLLNLNMEVWTDAGEGANFPESNDQRNVSVYFHHESDLPSRKAHALEAKMPVWLTRRIVLVPSHDVRFSAQGQLSIFIDSGNKFGSGAHPTTRICLAMLEAISQEEKSVLDLGTGTGILAICAAQLKAKRVIAIDQDFEACQVAKRNIVKNEVTSKSYVINCRLDALSEKTAFDVVLANLELETLLQVIRPLKRHLSPNGFLVISGVLKIDQGHLSDILACSGFTILSSLTEDEWAGFLASTR